MASIAEAFQRSDGFDRLDARLHCIDRTVLQRVNGIGPRRPMAAITARSVVAKGCVRPRFAVTRAVRGSAPYCTSKNRITTSLGRRTPLPRNTRSMIQRSAGHAVSKVGTQRK